MVRQTEGVVESATEQEIADAKAVIGRSGIGCEPASAATLAGVRKLVGKGLIKRDATVVGVLTGNVLKDPDYIYRYHTSDLKTPGGELIASTFANQPQVVSSDPGELIQLLNSLQASH